MDKFYRSRCRGGCRPENDRILLADPLCNSETNKTEAEIPLREMCFVLFTLSLYFLFFFTLRASCGAVYCNRSCLFVGLFVDVFVCVSVGLLPR